MSEYQEISVDQIDEPDQELRSVATESGMSELIQSIRENGVLEPVLVRKKAKRYEILAGWRRFTAAKQAGLATVPCRVMDVSKEEGTFIGLSENLQREDMNHVDLAVQFARLANEHKLTPKQIGQKIGKTDEYVRQHLLLLNLEDKILQSLVSGEINFTQARELCKVDSAPLRMQLWEQAAKFGANARTLSIMRQNARRESREHIEAVRRQAEATQPPPEADFTDVCSICGQEHDGRQTELIKMCPQCSVALKQGLIDAQRKNEEHMENNGE